MKKHRTIPLSHNYLLVQNQEGELFGEEGHVQYRSVYPNMPENRGLSLFKLEQKRPTLSIKEIYL